MTACARRIARDRGAALAGLILLLALLGCSSSKEASSSSAKKSSREYETEFDPRKYDTKDQPSGKSGAAGESPASGTAQPPPVTAERMERTSGYRVQIYSTYDLDEALRSKGTSQALLDTLKVYMVYDAPIYKIRVGDYLTKADADSAKELLRGKGFTDAWVVPDQVSRIVPADK